MMAAISGLSFHSASRRSEKLPATVSDTTRKKRTRDPSHDSDILPSTKKPKIFPQAPSRPKPSVRTYSKKNDPTFREIILKDAVTRVDYRNRSVQQNIVDRRCTPNSEATPLGSQINAAIKGPLKAVKQDEKRTLRSHDGGSRSKSELASYFSNYDDIVSNEPKEPGTSPISLQTLRRLLIFTEFLTAETRIHIIDEPAKAPASSLIKAATLKNGLRKPRPSNNPEKPPANGSVASNSTPAHSHTLIPHDAQYIEFPTVEDSTMADAGDPLHNGLYAKAHRRAERSEKQLRNIEKERSMHEKAQLERILDGLNGHDWLKVMGVSGVTDGEKKLWEPKKDYFIREVETLLEKFREWKEDEKRLKAERDERRIAEEDDDGDKETPSNLGTPEYSDADAWAVKQLQQETVTATGRQKLGNKSKVYQFTPQSIEKPFTSFYSKPYLREAALGKHRRGRTRLAFGHPLPAVPERDFSLPEGLLTHDALAASARSRRRARRESKI